MGLINIFNNIRKKKLTKLIKMTITVMRLSDGETKSFEDVGPDTKVKVLKQMIYDELSPANPNGCRLIFAGSVLKGRKKLKRYDIIDNQIIEMDDTKNWSDASSS